MVILEGCFPRNELIKPLTDISIPSPAYRLICVALNNPSKYFEEGSNALFYFTYKVQKAVCPESTQACFPLQISLSVSQKGWPRAESIEGLLVESDGSTSLLSSDFNVHMHRLEVYHGDSDSAGLRRGPRFCIPNKHPSGADAAI